MPLYRVTIYEHENKETPSKLCSFIELIDLMMMLPHGIQRMHPTVEGLVQTSIAFSLLSTNGKENKIDLQLFGRSSSMNEMHDMNRRLDCIFRMFGKGDISGMVELFPGFLRVFYFLFLFRAFIGWDPNPSSPALEKVKMAHSLVFPKHEPADVYAVHAGLECGLLMTKYPKLDCVSIGPTIEGAHSPDEKLRIPSVIDFYEWLRESVAQIGQLEA